MRKCFCYHKVLFLSLILLIVFNHLSIAQISVSNQLEYSNWNEYNRNVLENWTDVSFQHDQYEFGIRYEINQPPDPFIFDFDSLLKQEELTFRYARIYHENLTVTVGNYYALFGRGLTLRTYEDRNLRVDNNIDGVKANYYTDLFEITALGGRMRDKYNRRKDRIYGFDGSINVSENLKLGTSVVRNQLSDTEFTDLKSVRLSYMYSDFDFYSEFAKKSNLDELSGYGSLSYAGEYFTTVLEYKDYNRLALVTDYGTEYNAPPSLSREHIYTLLNRHPHQLNTGNEVGYQFEITSNYFGDFELLFNSSKTYSIAKTNFFHRLHSFLDPTNNKKQKIFEEYYAQIGFFPNENWHFEGALGWNSDHSSNTENITPIFMTEYNWEEINEFHFEFQHQHVKSTLDNSEYDDELVVLEYTRSPFLNLTLVGEYSNQNKLNFRTEDKTHWIYGQVTLSFLENQQVSILYGSRQAGFVCVGGVCRFEPEFEGLEIKLLSRF